MPYSANVYAYTVVPGSGQLVAVFRRKLNMGDTVSLPTAKRLVRNFNNRRWPCEDGFWFVLPGHDFAGVEEDVEQWT